MTNTNVLCIVTNHPRLAQLSVASKAGLQRQFTAFVLDRKLTIQSPLSISNKLNSFV